MSRTAIRLAAYCNHVNHGFILPVLGVIIGIIFLQPGIVVSKRGVILTECKLQHGQDQIMSGIRAGPILLTVACIMAGFYSGSHSLELRIVAS